MKSLLLFIAISSVCILFMVASACTQSPPEYYDIDILVEEQCKSEFKYEKPTAEELSRILSNHQAWYKDYVSGEVKSSQFDSRRADLCMSNLEGISLNGVNLMMANLSGAELQGADLRGANLIGADLRRARLDNANLSGAQLNLADVSGAWFDGSDLSGADLVAANVNATVFEPKVLPDPESFVFVKNLSRISYIRTPSALMRLRKNLNEAGLSKEEREVTYAIKHLETERKLIDGNVGEIFDGIFNFVFFEFTVLWGMAPGRALIILISLIPVFAVPYIIVLKHPSANGIWRKWWEDRVRVDLGSIGAVRLSLGWRQAFAVGIYFSVLSAFNIGFREFNVGTWIERLQKNEYTLRATGWVRTISGIQALISVYLFAIWILSYFSRPFG